jgi:hypothetical protein
MPIFRDRPSPQVDNFLSGAPSRAGRYGEAYGLGVSGKEWPVADEGSYFLAQNPTPGTGIIGPVATTFVETTPLLVVYNGGQNRVYPQFLRLHVTAAGASDTRVQFTHVVDSGNRYSSGGSTLTVNNVNMDSVVTSQVVAKFGALTATAASATRRLLGTTVFRGTIGIVEDAYEFVYGAADGSGMGGSRVATVVDMARLVAPVVIGPGQSYVLHDWAGGIGTGRTYAVELGFIER